MAVFLSCMVMVQSVFSLSRMSFHFHRQVFWLTQRLHPGNSGLSCRPHWTKPSHTVAVYAVDFLTVVSDWQIVRRKKINRIGRFLFYLSIWGILVPYSRTQFENECRCCGPSVTKKFKTILQIFLVKPKLWKNLYFYE